MPVLGVTKELVLFVNGLGVITEPAGVIDAVHDVASPTGLNVYAAWRIPVFRTDVGAFTVGQNVFPHSSVPAAYWLEYWPLAKLYGTSPSSQFAMLSQRPMSMTEAMRALSPSGKQLWLYDLLHKHGLRDLLYCPCGRWMLTYWCSKKVRLQWDARAGLNLLSLYAISRLDDLIVAKKIDGKAPPLSAREAEILRLASRGLRAQAIANMLEIAEDTVRHHLKNVTKKLGAKSPMHAACQALRLHLIS